MQVTRDGDPPRPGSTPGGTGEVGALSATTERVPTFEPGELFGDDDSEATQAVAAPFELHARFTGRGDAVARLLEIVEQSAKLRELGFALVVGEPGMGRSRLTGELVRTVRASHPEIRVLGAVADNSGIPYAVVARALAQRFAIAPDDSDAIMRDRITAGIAAVLPPAKVTEVSHLIAHLMRVPFEDSPVVGPLVEAPQQLEARTFLALRRLLGADAERAPLVLALENLEQCGAETINLLHYLAAGLQAAPVVLIGTATAALYDRHPTFGDGDIGVEKLELGALPPDEAEALLRELCAPLDQVPNRLVAHARSLGGSPRALYELVRLLLESDVIVRGAGRTWRLDPVRLAGTNLPRSYDELVAARLAVMEPVERRVIEMAAAIGETCWLDCITALERVTLTRPTTITTTAPPVSATSAREAALRYGTDAGWTMSDDGGAATAAPPAGANGATVDLATSDPDGPTLAQIAASGDHSRHAVTAALARLVEREWLVEVEAPSVPGERELRFAYPILHTLVYRGIDDARRRRYHRTVARWLELRPEGRGPLAQEDVGRHLELAGETRDAAARYRRAAEAARTAFDSERAIRLFDRALTCIGDSDVAARIPLWHDLGSVFELIGDFEAALGAFERMLRLSWVVSSKAKAAVAFNKMGRVWRRKGDLKLALEYLERGAELFRHAGDARGIAGSLDDIGKVLHLLGRYDDAFEKITAALAQRGKGGDKRSIAASLSNLGNVQQDRGQFEAAATCHQEALALRRETGDRSGVIVSQNNLGVLSFELGDLASARAGWTEALAEAEAIGALPMSAIMLTNLGELALHEGHLEEARGRLEDALQLIEDIEDRQLEAECCRLLARLEVQLGHADDARELAQRALGVAAAAGLRESEGLALITLGQVLSQSLYDADRTEVMASPSELPAEQYFRRGVELLRAIGNDAEVAKGLEQFGLFKLENGQIGEGKGMLREALVVFTRLGMRRGADVEKVLASL